MYPIERDRRNHQFDIDTVADLQEAGFGHAAVGKQAMLRCVSCQISRGNEVADISQADKCWGIYNGRDLNEVAGRLVNAEMIERTELPDRVTLSDEAKWIIGDIEPPAWCEYPESEDGATEAQ